MSGMDEDTGVNYDDFIAGYSAEPGHRVTPLVRTAPRTVAPLAGVPKRKKIRVDVNKRISNPQTRVVNLARQLGVVAPAPAAMIDDNQRIIATTHTNLST